MLSFTKAYTYNISRLQPCSKLFAIAFSALCLLPGSNAHATKNATSKLSNAAASTTARWSDYTVLKGDNLSIIFRRAGLSPRDVLNVSNATAVQKTFVRMLPGEKISFQLRGKSLQQIKYLISANTTIVITQSDTAESGYSLSREVKENQALIATQQKNSSAAPVQETTPSQTQSSVVAFAAKIDANTAKISPQVNSATSDSIIEPAVSELDTVLQQQDPSQLENWVYYSVQPEDNLTTLFTRAGLTYTDVHYVIGATREEPVFNRLMPNEKIGLLIRSGHLLKIQYIVNPLKTVLLTRTDKSNYHVETLQREPVISYKSVAGRIENSLFVDALNAGLSNNMTMNFAKVFAWDVDFSQDLQPGDKFKVVYEEMTIDGEKIKDGNIVAAQFDIGGQSLIGIFYRDSDGGVGFYTPDGHSMRKAFLRMPVEFARISSKYNPRRKHPILNKIRAHKGVDYAAKRGTPIMASGNGKIVYRGRKGSFGNTIVIQHGTSFNTLYAHMSRFNKAFKLGSRVQQGQVIGYVGSTGAATGAHLHYEFRVDGVHKNPLKVKIPKALALDPKELKAFKTVAKVALQKLNKLNDEELASVN